ncbi:MAG TPA: LysM peptidoglycan-binding domain-containing protein [Candidatus Sulfotelmatobacter sp.]|nr:LysM peptidoglycan-binding domain-containing protein [Candidatus Sulfotelmatobacter sp.]
MTTRRKPTLMPLVALAALGLSVTLPVLSTSVHAASPVAYTNVTVRPGDTVWSLAERRTAAGGDVQSTVDAILTANHLGAANLSVGQHLRVPQ